MGCLGVKGLFDSSSFSYLLNLNTPTLTDFAYEFITLCRHNILLKKNGGGRFLSVQFWKYVHCIALTRNSTDAPYALLLKFIQHFFQIKKIEMKKDNIKILRRIVSFSSGLVVKTRLTNLEVVSLNLRAATLSKLYQKLGLYSVPNLHLPDPHQMGTQLAVVL